MVSPHPYLTIPLQAAGLVVAAWLVLFHLWMLLKPAASQEWLGRAHRNTRAGVVVMTIGMLWFWLVVMPEMKGGLAFLSGISMDLGDPPGGFNGLKRYLFVLVPLMLVALCLFVKEYLFVRGLGLTCLMAAAPILMSAFQEEPATRLLLVVLAYAMIIKGLAWVWMPYVFRDAIAWARQGGRWKALALAGLAYGAAVLLCALLFWGK